MSNLYLVGFMGAGKSAAGRVLAERLGRPFVDLDELVEQSAGQSIGELFARGGETGFRQAEREALARISHQLSTAAGDVPHSAVLSRLGVLDVLSSTPPRPSGRNPHCARHLAALATKPGEISGLDEIVHRGGAVVATGGGAFVEPGNRELMHAHGGESVFLDLPWPVLAERLGRDRGDRPLWSNAGEARRLWQARRPHYLAATWTLALAGSETPAEVAERVAALVSGAACAT